MITANNCKLFIRIKNFILILISFFLSTCANQLPPGGGEIDLIPPQIIEVFPVDGTTYFAEEYFELGFSEYVDKRSVKDAIFISPAVEGNLELDWSGKYVRVNFPQKLKENVTYVVTIGTDVADYNNRNRMAEAFSFTFATGANIDKKIITGKIYDSKPEDIMLFAYKIVVDTINPAHHKPDYISQAGNNGLFKLAGLAAGTYRIYAVGDEFRDLLYQPDQDRIGMPYADVTLSDTDTLFSNLNFFITKIDTVKPRILSAVMTDANHILVNFSEEIDSTIISSQNFSLVDSISRKTFKALYAFKGNTKPTEIVLAANEKFNENSEVILVADTLRDKSGNIYLSDSTQITLNNAPDTTKVGIAKTIPSGRTDKADFLYQKFYFYFNDAFDSTLAKSGIVFKDTLGKFISYNISFIDDASLQITPGQRLEPQKDYIIEFDLSKFKDAAGNSYDSVYQYKFKTISGLDFTGASGILLNVGLSRNPILVLEKIGSDKVMYKKSPDENLQFNFERIEAGKYILWSFLDEDSSGEYSYGSYYPFKPAEEFSFYPDTLELRPRWVQTDLKFLFK